MKKALDKIRGSIAAFNELLDEADEAQKTLEKVRAQVIRVEKMFRPTVDLSHVVDLAKVAEGADSGVFLVSSDGSEQRLKR